MNFTESNETFNAEFKDVQKIKGDKGDRGYSAYEIAVQNGFKGTEAEWLESLKGADGKDGQNGAKGEKGDKGDTGAQGIQGEQGLQGEKGADGYTPIKGVDYYTDEEKNEIKSLIDEAAEEASNAAEESAEAAEASEKAATQAFKDLLEMIQSGQIATLIDGKIPVENIPSIATTEIYTAATMEEMQAIEAQRGDICIRTDELKSYIFNDTWIYLVAPTDYAAKAGHADTATNATNANTINGHRLIEMTEEEFEAAVKDTDTYYLVY